MQFAVPELLGRLGECAARQTIKWGNLWNAVSSQSLRLQCPAMDYYCVLCPWFVAKSAGEKKRHKESHKKSRNSDGAFVKTVVEGHKVDCDGCVGEREVGLAADGDFGSEAEGLGAAAGGLGLNDQVSSHTFLAALISSIGLVVCWSVGWLVGLSTFTKKFYLLLTAFYFLLTSEALS